MSQLFRSSLSKRDTSVMIWGVSEQRARQGAELGVGEGLPYCRNHGAYAGAEGRETGGCQPQRPDLCQVERLSSRPTPNFQCVSQILGLRRARK